MIGAARRERRRANVAGVLDALGVDTAVFAAPHSVAWLSGFLRPGYLQYTPFRGGPALVVVDRGATVLVVDDAAELATTDPACRVATYPGYDIAALAGASVRMLTLFDSILDAVPSTAVGIGAELNALPAEIAARLRRRWPGSVIVPLDGALDGLRAIKDDDEIATLRRLFALVAIGHAAARDAVRAGAREIDAWTAAHGAIEAVAGHRVALGYDCVARSRPGNAEGAPGAIDVGTGGSLILDLGLHDEGYWTDSCRTYGNGRQPDRQRAAHAAVRAALEAGSAMVKPGVAVREIDRRMRSDISAAGFEPYPHHGGHGIGLTPFERPYVVEESPDRLDAGMVLTLEPGTYVEGEVAVRLEDAFVVTERGAELLTSFPLDDG
jgi:Xaa-Pro aminopeptidase